MWELILSILGDLDFCVPKISQIHQAKTVHDENKEANGICEITKGVIK